MVRLLTCLSILGTAATWHVEAQSRPSAEANQLHAAIVNGDVESLRYWLIDRHADASAPSEAEPTVTPLGRCIALAARTLDGSEQDREARSRAPQVSLRTLQAMVALLHQHGARLTDGERRQFAGPALRWFDDTVSTPPELASPQPAAAAPPSAADRATRPALTLGMATVALKTEARDSCNGTGHVVYLVNDTQLSVRANVTATEDTGAASSGTAKTSGYTVDPDSSWRLGCDVSTGGRTVRYELKGWR